MDSLMNIELARELLPKRKPDSHKGDFGKVLNIAGSGQYTGAAYLSSMSALISGCGYSILATPKSISPIIASMTPDLIIVSLDETESKSIAESALVKIEEVIEDVDVVSLGCGIGTHPQTVDFVKKLVKLLNKYNKTTIIDADGINCLSMIREFVLPENTLLTPHPKELSRLMSIDTELIQSDRVKFTVDAAKMLNCSILLKGAKTVIANSSGEYFINPTQNSGLSKAGTGDVLLGLVAGLASQGATIFDSAKLGAFIHGTAGDIATQELTEYCLTASQLLQYIPKAIRLLT